MKYTIVSAAYANADSSAVVIQTVEVGAVMISQVDRPELWGKFQEWVTAGGVTGAYVAPTAADPSDLANLSKERKAILLAAAAMSGKTPAQAKAAFKTAWDSL